MESELLKSHIKVNKINPPTGVMREIVLLDIYCS